MQIDILKSDLIEEIFSFVGDWYCRQNKLLFLFEVLYECAVIGLNCPEKLQARGLIFGMELMKVIELF